MIEERGTPRGFRALMQRRNESERDYGHPS